MFFRYTLIPTSILLGLGAAPLWSAQCTYLTIMGNTEAKNVGKVGRDVVNQYFGIFFLIFQSSGVWGNLISSLVFGQTPTQGKRKRWSVMAPEKVPHPIYTHLYSTTRAGEPPEDVILTCLRPSLSWFPAVLQDGLCRSEGLSSTRAPTILVLPSQGQGETPEEQSPEETEGHCQWNSGSWSHHYPFRLRMSLIDLSSH